MMVYASCCHLVVFVAYEQLVALTGNVFCTDLLMLLQVDIIQHITLSQNCFVYRLRGQAAGFLGYISQSVFFTEAFKTSSGVRCYYPRFVTVVNEGGVLRLVLTAVLSSGFNHALNLLARPSVALMMYSRLVVLLLSNGRQ